MFSLEVAVHDIDQLRCSLGGFVVCPLERVDQVGLDVSFDDFAQQTVDGPATGSNDMHDLLAAGLALQRPFNRIDLAAAESGAWAAEDRDGISRLMMAMLDRNNLCMGHSSCVRTMLAGLKCACLGVSPGSVWPLERQRPGWIYSRYSLHSVTVCWSIRMASLRP